MSINLKPPHVEKEPEEEVEDERELKHQKNESNPDKFQRKTKLKRDVEDIFYLDGSKNRRNDYITQNIKE